MNQKYTVAFMYIEMQKNVYEIHSFVLDSLVNFVYFIQGGSVMMSEGSYIQELYAERIGGKNFGTDTVSYKFEKIKRAKKQAMEEHPTIKLIDLGVGEPDWMAEKDVIEVLSREAAKRENRGYSDNGSDAFKIAACAYMDHVFTVKGLNPLKEVNHCIGSKTALAQLPAAFINPGDITLMTTPGYPIVGTHTNWFGGEVYAMPLLKENNFLPDLNAIPKEIRARAKLLYMNYPNNPTGASATIEFYEETVLL